MAVPSRLPNEMSPVGTLAACIVMMPVAGTDTLYQGCTTCGLPGFATLLAALFVNNINTITILRQFKPSGVPRIMNFTRAVREPAPSNCCGIL
jgi:protein gp37